MAQQKKPDVDKKKPDDDLSSLMPTEEDLELLEMTERTLTRPLSQDEETISLGEGGKGADKKKATGQVAKTKSGHGPYDFTDSTGEELPQKSKAVDVDIEPEVIEIEPETDEEPELADAEETDQAEDDEELELEADSENEEAPDLSDTIDEVADTKPAKETPPPPKAVAKEPPRKIAKDKAKGQGPAKAAEKTKKAPTGKKKPYKLIALILVPVLAAVTVLIVLYLRQESEETPMTSSVNTRPAVGTPVSVPSPAAQATPVQPMRPETVSQPQTPARPAVTPGMAPQPQGTPAAQNMPAGASATPGTVAMNTVGQARQTMPATPPPTPVPPQPTPAGQHLQTPVAPATSAPTAQPPQPQVAVAQQAPAMQPAQVPAPPPQQVQKPAATTPAVAQMGLKPAAAPDKNAVHTLKGIDFRESGGTVQMVIQMDNPAVEYKCFALTGPTRVVVDLMGKWNKPPFENKNVSNSRVSRIRIGKDADKVRIVADISGGEVAPPTAAAAPDGLVVNITGK